MSEQEPRFYPPEARDLMALKERVAEGVGNVLKRNQGLVYYYSRKNEYTTTVSPQKEELVEVVSPVSAWASYPLKLDIIRFSPSSFLPEEMSRIDVNLSPHLHPGLRVVAVDADGTVNPTLNQRKILGESLVVLTSGVLPGEVLEGTKFSTLAAIENLGLGEIYPGEFSQETFEQASDALEELRAKKPVLFGIVASDLAAKATHGLFLNIAQVAPGTLRVEVPATQLFCFKLLLDILTPTELGMFGEKLLPVLPQEIFEEKQHQLTEEIEFIERRQQIEMRLTDISLFRTGLAAGLGANLLARTVTDAPISAIAFLSAYTAVTLSARGHFNRPLRERLLELGLAQRAQEKFGEEQRRRLRFLNAQD